MKYYRICLFFVFTSVINTAFAYNVVIKGEFYDSTSQKSISIRRFDYVLQKGEEIIKTSVENNKTFAFYLTISEPQVLRISGRDIYVSPGDSVSMVITSSMLIKATGINAGNYLFLSSIHYAGTPNVKSYENRESYKKELKDYHQGLDSLYADFKIRFATSKDFDDYVLKDNKYRYFNSLLSYCQIWNLKKEEVESDFLGDINENDLKSKFFVSNNYTKFLHAYVVYLSDRKKNGMYDKEDFTKIFASINTNLNDSEQEYIFLLNFIMICNEQNIGHKNLVDSVYSSYSINAKNRLFNDKVNINYEYYNLSTKPMPDTVLEEKLESYDGKVITFKELLDANKGKVVYMDFWASWCVYCLVEMPSSKKMSEKFESEGVSFVYISFDSKKENWQKSIKERGFDTWKNSYIISSGYNSEIANYLHIKSIPRYLIINSDSKIAQADSPRPSLPETSMLLQTYLAK